MNGIEAINAMAEGKIVKVAYKHEDAHTVIENDHFRMDEDVLVRGLGGEVWNEAHTKMRHFLLCEFEEVNEYPLNFFEAMRAVDEGKAVKSNCYESLLYKKNEKGILIYADDGCPATLWSEEIKAKWKIVEE